MLHRGPACAKTEVNIAPLVERDDFHNKLR
jgi:hypothetical protein